MSRTPAAWIAALVLASCGGGAQFGTVEFGQLTVDGAVDGDYLMAQLYQLDPRFEACYVQALRKDRSTEGRLELEMRGGGGRLIPKVTANRTGSADLGECVTTNIASLEIVEPEGGEPWDFDATWHVDFAIIRRNSARTPPADSPSSN